MHKKTDVGADERDNGQMLVGFHNIWSSNVQSGKKVAVPDLAMHAGAVVTNAASQHKKVLDSDPDWSMQRTQRTSLLSCTLFDGL